VFNFEKLKYILILILGFILFGCEKPKETGLEIYLVDIAYPDFTKPPKAECLYCFEPKKSDLFDEPLFTESDFKKFDWEKQQIILTDDGRRKLSEIEIPLEGLPVAMVLNKKPIYGFWFWNMVSSFGCDRVFTYPKMDFKIKFGLPDNNTFGEDPRFNSVLKDYLDEKN